MTAVAVYKFATRMSLHCGFYPSQFSPLLI
jgi:hypothetical protein